jgi:O-antigen/teichoic acid export membrane protein
MLFLDLGIGPLVTKDLARLTGLGGSLREIRDIIRTFELLTFALAAIVSLSVFAVSDFLASCWVNAQHVQAAEVATSISIGGLTLALQWCANYYSAVWLGLHRQIQLAKLTAGIALGRLFATFIFLLCESSLTSFFLAQTVVSLAQMILQRSQTWRYVGLLHHTPKFRRSLVTGAFEFASGMTGITIASVALTQIDKVVASSLLPLHDFGLYSLTSTIAGWSYVVVGSFFSNAFPTLHSLKASGHLAEMYSYFHRNCRTLAALVLPVHMILIFFSNEVLLVLTGNDQIGSQAGLLLSVFSIGNALNGLMNLPYALHLAQEKVRMILRISMIAITLMVPMLLLLIKAYGVLGGAWVWVAVNIGFISVWPSFIFDMSSRAEMKSWYLYDVFKPLFVAMLPTFIASMFIVGAVGQSRTEWFLLLLLVWVITASLTFFTSTNRQLLTFQTKSK